MSEQEQFNSIWSYEPFQWIERKVRLEGEGLDGADFQRALDSLARSLDRPDSDEMKHPMIDLYLFTVASQMLSALAARAANGKRSAAAHLDQAIRDALEDHRILLNRENPVILRRVQESPQMPGWVSNHKPLMDDEMRFSETIEQGKYYPFPPPATERGRNPSILTAQHLLVDHLYRFMVDTRRDWLKDEFWMEEEFGRMHPIIKRLRELPMPISSENWRQWYELGVEILNDSTGGNPEAHPMFKSGPFKDMNQGKFKDRLREAFEAKGKAFDRINEAKRMD